MATNEEIVAQAQQLYVSYYGRPADPDGSAFWIEYFTSTSDVDEALVAFGDSAEFQSIVADNPTSEELINQLYQFMFNRDAEDEGLEFYSDLLDSGEASLASIALDIANGAQNEDLDALDNKIEVANSFTAEVESEDAPYTEENIPAAQAFLATVDETDASVTAAEAKIPNLVEGIGGTFELNEDSPTADFSASTVAVTVTLAGDEDETEFDVTGSDFNDTVIFEEYFRAEIDGGAGTDTADFTDAEGAYTISLDAGTFSADVDGDGLPEFSGTLSGIESIIGSEQIDTVNGSDADERFDGGDSNDVLRGGAGDDTFVYGDEDDLGTEIADGQTGTDVIEFTADAIDLTATAPTNVSVESLLLSNADGSSTVTLSLDDTAGFGPEQFKLITGSSATDTLNVTAAGNANFETTEVNGVEILVSAKNLDVKSTTLDDVLTLSGPGGTGSEITASSAGTYDLSGTTVTGWNLLDGVTAAAGVIWVLNQTQIDAIIDEDIGVAPVLFDADMTEAGTTKIANDALQASGSLDLTRLTGGLNVYEIDFGNASSIEVDDIQFGSGLALIDGGAGTETLIINDPDADGIDVSGVELEDLAVVRLAGASSVDLTIDEAGFTGIGSVTGSTTTLTIDTTVGTETVDVTGSNLDAFTEVSFDADVTAASVKLDQGPLDDIDEWGFGLADGETLEFELGAASLDLSAVDFDDTFGDTTSLVTVTGGEANETVTEANGDDEDVAMPFTYNLGKGDDKFIGTDKEYATGTITINGEDGDDTITLAEVDTGAYDVSGGAGDDTITGDLGDDAIDGDGGDDALSGGAGDDVINGGNDDDTITGGAGDDTLAGDAGDDILTAGAGTDVLDGGADDDDMTAGYYLDTLTGGAGDDIFTMAMDQLGVTTTDFNATGTDVFNLDFKINGTDTAFSDILVNNKVPVLQVSGSSGDVVNIGANNAIGSGTAALQALADTAAVLAYLNTALSNAASFDNTNFVLFGTSSSRLVAYIIDKNGSNTAITSGEINRVTRTYSTTGGGTTTISAIAALGGAGAISESDLILI